LGEPLDGQSVRFALRAVLLYNPPGTVLNYLLEYELRTLEANERPS
jgi:hypothetical protein